MPSLMLNELAKLVSGHIVGDGTITVDDALPLRDAKLGCLTLADSAKQVELASQSPAAAVVVGQAFDNCKKVQLVVVDIHAAFIKLIEHLRQPTATIFSTSSQTNIAASAIVDSSASIGEGTKVSAQVVIEAGVRVGRGCLIHPGVTVMNHCVLGDDCELFPGCVIYPDTRIGNRVLIHSNAVIGAYGFGYRQHSGKHVRTAQLGWVEIHDDVEIGAGTTIDRGTYGATKIGQGTKIDNQVQIGHNCHIGAHNLLCAQVGIAGSCTTGNYVVMGGQVGLADHLKVADGAMIAAQSGLMSDVAAGEVVIGSPAGPRKQKFVEIAALAKLPEMRKEFRALVQRVEQIADEQSHCDRKREAA